MLKKAGYTKFSEFPVVLSTKVTGKIGKTEKEEEEEKEQGP